MKGDFSRDSFDPQKNFTRVLMQQGRVQLDADWNEQGRIFSESLRTLVMDLVGRYGGPESNCGFGIFTAQDSLKDFGVTAEQETNLKRKLNGAGDFLIGPGHYYVDGILANNPDFVVYSQHINGSALAATASNKYLIYLDVWERHITDIEDDSIREVALKGANTCTRAKLVWSVRSWSAPSDFESSGAELLNKWDDVLDNFRRKHRGLLTVQLKNSSDDEGMDPTIIAPGSRYRGSENQLYRVEIHRGGTINEKPNEKPTFKWSRENGSVVFPIVSIEGSKVTLSHLGQDLRSGLQVGDWVEVVDDDYVMKDLAEPLWQVKQIDTARMQVTLTVADPTATSAQPVIGRDPRKHPLMRRWDQKKAHNRREEIGKDGAVMLHEGDWLTLENGIQIKFITSGDPRSPHSYRTGDYWQIPARVVTGDVQWPHSDGKPDAVEPHGVDHHYAPLAFVEFENGVLKKRGAIRPKFRLTRSF